MSKDIRLEVKGIMLLKRMDNCGLVVLVGEHTQKQIGVPCTKAELGQIERLLDAPEQSKHTLPYVLWGVLTDNTADHFELRIVGVSQGSYNCILLNADQQRMYPLKASEAIILSLIAHLPIYITAYLFGRQAVERRQGGDQMALPVNILSDEMLHQALDRAVAREDYELASAIKEELAQRKE